MDRIYLSPPEAGKVERELLLDAFDSNWIAPMGPHVDAFEREFAEAVGVPYAAALSSGTAALHLALIALGVGRDDVVLTSTLTFAATVNAITYVGARPVFIDVSPDTWTIDPVLLEEELAACQRRGTMPAAVMTVDLYGQCADYDLITAICGRYGVPIVEDAAEGLGATYGTRNAGAFGECAAFSFNGNKIITTSGGGMRVSHRRDIIERARHLATQARQPVAHYEHRDIGFNYRLSNLLAAIGRGQLRDLPRRVARRRDINWMYRQALDLPGITFLPDADYGRSSCWLTCIVIDPEAFGATSEQVRQQLEAENIESRPVWKPMHMQPVFEREAVRGGAVAHHLFEHGLCLPSGSSLSADDLGRVVSVLEATPAAVAGRHSVLAGWRS
jgi:dTDP-4-amino-4,6-dideoxygalactose transaminase